VVVQVLREFEVDIDFGGNSIALHPPGHIELGLCDTRGLVEVPLRLTKSEWASGSHSFMLTFLSFSVVCLHARVATHVLCITAQL
jgi:hypothetical protein